MEIGQRLVPDFYSLIVSLSIHQRRESHTSPTLAAWRNLDVSVSTSSPCTYQRDIQRECASRGQAIVCLPDEVKAAYRFLERNLSEN
jgi:hypothetical protein